MPRRIEVEITGDSRQLEQAFDRSSRAAQKFNTDVAVGAARVATGAFVFTQALEGAAAAAAHFGGENSQMARGLGDASKAISSLVTLNPAGFFEALGADAKRTEERMASVGKTLGDANDATRKLDLANKAAAAGFGELADKMRDEAAAATALQTSINAVEFSQRKWNATVVDGVNALVAFKGAADDVGGLRGVGLAESITARPPPPGRKSLRGLSPSERREIALLGQEGGARLPGLRNRLAQLQGADPRTHAGLVRNRENIKRTEAEIQTILEAQAAARDASRRAAEAEALAARERARLAREAALAAAKARQLGVLQDPLPTPANLRRQLAGLQARRGELPRNIQDRLGAIGRLLGSGGTIYEETREGIRDYFRMVRGEFQKGEELLKPVAVRGLNTGQVVRGLGLSAIQNRRIQNRLAGVNVAGQAVADVYLDGEKVGRVQKRHGQRDRINSPKQKRGPNAGR